MKIRAILADKGDEVQTIRPGADATIATALMKTHSIASLVVTDDERVVGLVGERDIVRAVATGNGSIAGLKVRDLMDQHPETCSPNDAINEVMAIMTRQRRRHIPVVEDGRLSGIVSIGDMVNFTLNEMELESRILRDAYITKH
jgi:CBS domain-containing protein